jgi:hypothetical protein
VRGCPTSPSRILRRSRYPGKHQTCTQAYHAAHGIGVFNPSTVVVASGLVLMNTSGQIFGAMSDEGLFENVSYPAGVFP